ncbi:MMPL family transporter [Allokutzneria oryzae]|uniref:MMPL family transporter n=1 Tax=Allokutzneria oryzae TaxID=1378989 RepID=A0ABV6A0R4_9PSEU
MTRGVFAGPARSWRWPLVFGAVVAAVVGVLAGIGSTDRLSYGGYIPDGAESARTLDAVRDRLGHGGADVLAVFRHPHLTVTDPAFRAGVDRAVADLPPGLATGVTTYWSSGIPILASRDAHATIVAVLLAGTDDTARARSYQLLREHLRPGGFEVGFAGPVAMLDEAISRSDADLTRAGLFGLPFVFLLLLWLFRSVLAALVPLVMATLAIGITLGLVSLWMELTEISALTYNAVGVLGFTLAVDVAVFVVSRFREELDRGAEVDDAVSTTVATAGRTAFLSGLTVSGIASALFFFPLGLASSIGVGGCTALAVSCLLSVTVLPAMLGLLGRRLTPARRLRASDTGQWARVATAVMAQPVHYLVLTALVLAILTTPALRTTIGFPNERELPPDASSRVAAERIRADFAYSPLDAAQVVVTFAAPVDSSRGEADLVTWLREVDTATGGRAGVIAARADRTVALYFTHPGTASDPAAREFVHLLRSLPPPGGEVLVGGAAAMAVDALDTVHRRLPWALLYAVLFALVWLTVALRSFVLPIKAVVLTALSLGVSFGALTWVFQEGHLLWLVDATHIGHVDVVVPVVLLLLLIGLSTDFEFFLLARIRERYEETGDNELAVASGLQRCGPLITTIVLIMLVNAAVFAASEISLIKQVSVGMFIALALDATVVRAVLVPAVMRLLGRANWWFPTFGGRS